MPKLKLEPDITDSEPSLLSTKPSPHPTIHASSLHSIICSYYYGSNRGGDVTCCWMNGRSSKHFYANLPSMIICLVCSEHVGIGMWLVAGDNDSSECHGLTGGGVHGTAFCGCIATVCEGNITPSYFLSAISAIVPHRAGLSLTLKS